MISNVHLVYPFISDPSGPPGFCGLVRTPCENCKDRKESHENDSEDATYIQLAKEKKKEGPPVTMYYSPKMNKSKESYLRNLQVKPRSGGSSDMLTLLITIQQVHPSRVHISCIHLFFFAGIYLS